MRRYLKKMILILMISTIVLPSFMRVVLAAEEEKEEPKSNRSTFSDVIDSYSADSYGALANEGKADIKESSEDQSEDLATRTQTTLKPVTMASPSTAFLVCSFFNILIAAAQGIMSIVFVDHYDDAGGALFTIYDLLSGQYAIFDANFMEFEAPSDGFWIVNSSAVFNSGKEVNNIFKTVVSQWFQIIKNISYIIGLCVLIYVGIRMAMSTVASEQAKYKKMLIDWGAGIVVIIVMPYIISIASYVSDALIDIFGEFLQSNDNFEKTILTEVILKIPLQTGWSAFIITIEYFILVAVQIRFALLYMKRFLALGFLILIGPIVSVTYAIDSIGDGKAQAFQKWFSELLKNLFIQPLHLIIYLVFLASAGELFVKYHLLGIIFLLLLTRIEKVLLKLFSMGGAVTLETLQDQKLKSKGIL